VKKRTRIQSRHFLFSAVDSVLKNAVAKEQMLLNFGCIDCCRGLNRIFSNLKTFWNRIRIQKFPDLDPDFRKPDPDSKKQERSLKM